MFDLTKVQNYEDMLPYKDVYKNEIKDLNKRFCEELLIVELGVRAGVSARILYESLHYGSAYGFKLVLIDIKKHPQTKIFDDFEEVEFIESKAETVFDKFDHESIHLLHVDVDPHEYEQAFQIFTLYKRKIKKQGKIIFHDCSPKFGVKKAVEEIGNISGWEVVYCEPHSDCPEAVPAIVRKNV